MENKTNQQLVALLKDDALKEAAGLQLLKQSPSNNELQDLIHKKVQRQAAWNLLKDRATKEELLSMAIWCDMKDEIGEVLLKMKLDNEDLRFMLQRSCSMEAAWQRLLKQSPSRDTLFTLLNLSPYRNTIAQYLLTQSPDNAFLKSIIYHTDLKREAWNILKTQQPTARELVDVMDNELASEVWAFFLQSEPQNEDFRWVIRLQENIKDLAAAELLKRPTEKEDLLCIVGNTSLWEPAWEELLRRGANNFDLTHLIESTAFKELAWEQLKKQSPTNWELRCAINTEMESLADDEDEIYLESHKYNIIVGSYLLASNPSIDDLKFLIGSLSELRDEAIDMLLAQPLSRKDKEYVFRYRPSLAEAEKDLGRPRSNEELMEVIINRPELRTAAWDKMKMQSPGKEELLYLLAKQKSLNKNEIWEELEKHPLSKEELIEIIKLMPEPAGPGELLLQRELDNDDLIFLITKTGFKDAPARRLLRQYKKKDELYEIINHTELKMEALNILFAQWPADPDFWNEIYDEELKALMARDLLQKKEVDNHHLFEIIRRTHYKQEAWELMKGQSPDDEVLLKMLCYTDYTDIVWDYLDKTKLSVYLLVELSRKGTKKEESILLLKGKLLLPRSEEEASEIKIALKMLNDDGIID